MNKDQQHFDEQDAPLKNTDKAFVKVNKDGSPDKGANIGSQEMGKKAGKDEGEESSREKPGV